MSGDVGLVYFTKPFKHPEHGPVVVVGRKANGGAPEAVATYGSQREADQAVGHHTALWAAYVAAARNTGHLEES